MGPGFSLSLSPSFSFFFFFSLLLSSIFSSLSLRCQLPLWMKVKEVEEEGEAVEISLLRKGRDTSCKEKKKEMMKTIKESLLPHLHLFLLLLRRPPLPPRRLLYRHMGSIP